MEKRTVHSKSEMRRLEEQGVDPETMELETVEEGDFPLGQACDPTKMEECESCQ